MSYEVFIRKVNALIERADNKGLSVRFSTDLETGRHFARFSDGTSIIANTQCKKVEVRWNRGNHSSITAI